MPEKEYIYHHDPERPLEHTPISDSAVKDHYRDKPILASFQTRDDLYKLSPNYLGKREGVISPALSEEKSVSQPFMEVIISSVPTDPPVQKEQTI